MTIKTYDAGEFLVEYEVRPTTKKYTFEDHTGKTVTMTELGFFDPWFIDEMGFTTKLEVAEWFYQNYLNEVFNDCTSVFKDNITRYFDHSLMGRGEVPRRYFTAYIEEYERPNVYETRFSGRETVPSYQLVVGEEEEQQQEVSTKPVYKVYSFNWHRTVIKEKETQGQTGGNPAWTQEISGDWKRQLNYTYKMDPEAFNFFRKLDKETDQVPMYGLELELSTELSCEEIQYIVCEVEPKQEPFFVFKQDSSISGRYDNQVEVVTVPCTRRYLKKAWALFFKKLEKLCEAKGKTIGDYFDTSRGLSNGIHIHVSKDKFYDDFHKRKFLASWNQWDTSTIIHMTKVAQRPQEKYNQNSYCPLDPGFEGRTLARRLGKKIRSQNRSVCHDSNPHTMEVRLYQGIVSLDHIHRCIDHIDAMFEYTSRIKLKDFGMNFVPAFEEFICKGLKYKGLREFILNGYQRKGVS